MPSELLPIGEVARRTGVNPVTLRAWERRYGLLLPQRTASGHRLYSLQQVERIQQVLGWLARGVAVSQVRELLDGRPLRQPAGDSPWQQRLSGLQAAIQALDERRLDQQFNQALALYPPVTLYQHLLAPLLEQLELLWHGQAGSLLERHFLHGWLRTRLGARLYQLRQQASAPALLLACLDSLAGHPQLWLTAWLLAEQGRHCEVLDSPLPASELLLACERLQPAALLLHADASIDAVWLRRDLPRLLARAPCPLHLSGAATCIHDDLPGELACSHDPLQALAWLQSLETGT